MNRLGGPESDLEGPLDPPAEPELDLPDPGCLDEPRPEVLDQQGTGNTDNSNSGLTLDELFNNTRLSELRLTNQFIQELQKASLNDRHSGLDSEALHRLRNPPTEQFSFENQTDGANLRLAFDIFLASLKASVDVYNTTRTSILRRHPEDNLPSYD